MINCDQLRIVFAGTPEFAVPPLQTLAASGHTLAAVYTQPDRPSGRGRKLVPSPVKQLAQELNLTCCQPESLRDPDAVAALAALRPDIMVVVAYGQILPQQVLSIPTLGCLNIHASVLPRWRGAAPIHRAILAGDTSTGVSIMKMDAGLDTGPVLLSRAVDIDVDTDTRHLHDTLSALGADCLLEAIDGWCQGDIVPQEQTAEQASYADKITKAEALIDWRQPAVTIHRQVRAFNPWPVAETALSTRSISGRLRLWRADLPQTLSGRGGSVVPGTVLRCEPQGLEVACGTGSLLITELQLPGRKPVSAGDFANSQDITGTVLGSESA